MLSTASETGDVVKTYTYDTLGNRASFTLEVDSVTELSQTYTYDVMNRLYQVYENNTLTATYAYDTMGNRASLTYANGVVESYAYNLANLVTSVTNTCGQTTLSSYTYAYNLSGNQTSKTDHTGRVTAYTYDDNGRLLTETEMLGEDTVFSATYTYDLRGNRLTMVVTGAESYTTAYTYDANNRLLQENKTVGEDIVQTAYAYDDNGNTIGTVVGEPVDGIIPPGTGVETTYTYDVFNRLIAVGEDITYTYRPDGLRLSKTVDEVTTIHIWDGTNIVAETDGTDIIAVYIRGINLIAIDNGTAVSYYLYNAHGDVVQLTNSSGTVTKSYDYDAFGNERSILTTDTNPFRYCGEYYDKETGKLYLRARYYDPATGRFTQQDGWNYANPKDPLSLNLYVYCASNPVMFVDPLGNSKVDVLRGVSALYNANGVSADAASMAIIAANGFGIWTAMHEIAQINIAKKLYDKGYGTAVLEYKISNRLEADVVLNKCYVWEVKPFGTSGEKQLAKYLTKGGLIRGNLLSESISNIPVIGNIKMMIVFRSPGMAEYLFYRDGPKGEKVYVSMPEARDAIFEYQNSQFREELKRQLDSIPIYTPESSLAGLAGLAAAAIGIAGALIGVPVLVP